MVQPSNTDRAWMDRNTGEWWRGYGDNKQPIENAFEFNGQKYRLTHHTTAKAPYKLPYYEKRGRIQIDYGFDLDLYFNSGNNAPHFHITGTTFGPNGQWASGGCIHDEITKHSKRLATLIPYHLWGWPGTPMHYIDNAAYWMEFALGISKWKRDTERDPLAIFQDHIGFGIVDSDMDLMMALVAEYGGVAGHRKTEKAIMSLKAVQESWEEQQVKAWLRQDLRAKLDVWLPARVPYIQAKFVQMMVDFKVAIPITPALPAPAPALEAENVRGD